RMYGDVPLVDHVPEQGNDEDTKMTLTRADKSDVYDFIEQDLKDAAEVLPDKGSAETGRATSEAAHALLATVTLYREDWQETVDQANQVTGYSLTSNYADIFKKSGENNEESIFEIQRRGGSDQPGI